MTTSSNIRNPFLARVFASNDENRGSSNNLPNVMSSTQSIRDQKMASVGVRRSQRDKTPLRDIVLGLIQTTLPGVEPLGLGRSPAHTVWISKNQLFTITGFHTEVFDMKNLSIATSKFRTSATLTAPDGASITIKPHGPAWIKLFEHMSAAHPHVTINQRVWALARRVNDTYEYVER